MIEQLIEPTPITETAHAVPDDVPFVSIIVPVYNGARTIRRCLDAIGALDYPNDRTEVIVVDNNSTDGTPDIVGQYPVRLLYERDLQGPHAATNTGLREAQGEIIAFTDSDCVPTPGWLRTLVAPFADGDVVATGGRIEAYRPLSRAERFIDQEGAPLKNGVQLADGFPMSLITANAAYRADALRAVGWFNANMYTGAEVDLAWRVQWATGKRAEYIPDALVYHIYDADARKLFRHYRIYGCSEIMLGTLYKHIPDCPFRPRRQLRQMLRQVRSLFIYVASFAYRSLTAGPRRRDEDYVSSPIMWLIAESGNLYGKVEALWATRFFRRTFWSDGPRVI